MAVHLWYSHQRRLCPPLQGDLILEMDRAIECVIKLGLYASKLKAVEINSSGS